MPVVRALLLCCNNPHAHLLCLLRCVRVYIVPYTMYYEHYVLVQQTGYAVVVPGSMVASSSTSNPPSRFSGRKGFEWIHTVAVHLVPRTTARQG